MGGQNITISNLKTRIKPQSKKWMELSQFALTNNCYKGCSYVQDTDENLDRLESRFKKPRQPQSHLTLTLKPKQNITFSNLKPDQTSRQGLEEVATVYLDKQLLQRMFLCSGYR